MLTKTKIILELTLDDDERIAFKRSMCTLLDVMNEAVRNEATDAVLMRNGFNDASSVVDAIRVIDRINDNV
jgi:hypothetical protein